MERRDISGWRMAVTLVGVAVGVALLGWGAWAAIDALLPNEEPAGSEPDALDISRRRQRPDSERRTG